MHPRRNHNLNSCYHSIQPSLILRFTGQQVIIRPSRTQPALTGKYFALGVIRTCIFIHPRKDLHFLHIHRRFHRKASLFKPYRNNRAHLEQRDSDSFHQLPSWINVVYHRRSLRRPFHPIPTHTLLLSLLNQCCRPRRRPYPACRSPRPPHSRHHIRSLCSQPPQLFPAIDPHSTRVHRSPSYRS